MTDAAPPQMAFDRFLGEVRPKLHRYCARMTGSVIDGEDVVQDVLLKAIEARQRAVAIEDLESWLFRIAHNAAIDLLRRRKRQVDLHSEEDLEMIADSRNVLEDRHGALASLRTFMRLPPLQRSSVILMDVLGYTLEEIAVTTGSSVPSIKSALHRGRTRLQLLSQESQELPLPVLEDPGRALLAAYVERFNLRDFDTLRDMLADEVRLELVNRTQFSGKAAVVATYFHNYSRTPNWRGVPGFIDRRPAILVRTSDARSDRFDYFILLEWTDKSVTHIRDFTHARYAIEDADVVVMA
jgi:RNA polymerase sigma-70 factor (ECF subfamily)